MENPPSACWHVTTLDSATNRHSAPVSTVQWHKPSFTKFLLLIRQKWIPAIYVNSFLNPLTFFLYFSFYSLLIFVYFARFEFLESILMKMQVFWNLTLCKLGKSIPAFRRSFGVFEVTDVSKELTCLHLHFNPLPWLLNLLDYRSRWDKVKRMWLSFGVCQVRIPAATLTLVITVHEVLISP